MIMSTLFFFFAIFFILCELLMCTVVSYQHSAQKKNKTKKQKQNKISASLMLYSLADFHLYSALFYLCAGCVLLLHH